MKNILLPTDFSVNSKNAIRYALELFKGTSVCFFILNVQKTSEFVLDDLMTADPGSSVYQAILKDNKQELQKFFSPLKEQYSKEDYKFKLYVNYDNLTASIGQMIKAESIDLIVMGTNGATGASEVLFGSNTLNTIRKIDCPLLVIPQDYAFKEIKSVVFTASSYKDIEHDRADPLKTLIRLTGAQLHILEILEENSLEEVHNSDAGLTGTSEGLDFISHTIRGLPEYAAISAFIQLMKSDLHALFIERETFLERFFQGNKAARISYGSKVPLLVLHK